MSALNVEYYCVASNRNWDFRVFCESPVTHFNATPWLMLGGYACRAVCKLCESNLPTISITFTIRVCAQRKSSKRAKLSQIAFITWFTTQITKYCIKVKIALKFILWQNFTLKLFILLFIKTTVSHAGKIWRSKYAFENARARVHRAYEIFIFH